MAEKQFLKKLLDSTIPTERPLCNLVLPTNKQEALVIHTLMVCTVSGLVTITMF